MFTGETEPFIPQSPISYLSKARPGVSIFFRCRTLRIVWNSSMGLPEYIHSWFLNSVRHLCQSLMPTLRASAPHSYWLVPADLHKNLELRSSGIFDSGSGSSPILASTLSALPGDKDNSAWVFLFVCVVLCFATEPHSCNPAWPGTYLLSCLSLPTVCDIKTIGVCSPGSTW